MINTVLNKAKIPIMLPLLENGLLVTDLTEKAQIFNDYFILQCTTIDTGSEIPHDAPVPTSLISEFLISDDKILNIIRSLNPNKAHPKLNPKKKREKSKEKLPFDLSSANIWKKFSENSITIPYTRTLFHMSYLTQINQVFVPVT